MKPHVLLIEDDDLLGPGLIDNLQMENFTVDWAQDGESGLQAATKNLHDIVILDIMVPKKNGFDVLKEIRQVSQVPVLILSAKSSAQDRILGLELDADDYLTKPFHFKELVLRILTLLKRKTREFKGPEVIQIGKAKIDFKSLSIQKDEQREYLTEKEMLVLKMLLSHQDQVISREHLLNQIWGTNNYPSTRTIDNIIVKLRKWIEADSPYEIRSHRGIGYALTRVDQQ